MKAVDTNVLARFFINDPDDNEAIQQRPAAIATLSQPVFVPISVVLEFEWVMRGFYELPRTEIEKVFRALSKLQTVTLEDHNVVHYALESYSQGLDFADALHLARSRGYQGLVSFDKRLQKRANSLGLSPPVENPLDH